jgi:hypothetical protein
MHKTLCSKARTEVKQHQKRLEFYLLTCVWRFNFHSCLRFLDAHLPRGSRSANTLPLKISQFISHSLSLSLSLSFFSLPTPYLSLSLVCLSMWLFEIILQLIDYLGLNSVVSSNSSFACLQTSCVLDFQGYHVKYWNLSGLKNRTLLPFSS